MNTGDGFLIMYSVIDTKSFNEVQSIYTKLEMIQEGNKVPGVIVGNKSDCESERQVTGEQGKSLATKFDWGFLEASAKTKKNITETFQEITRRMIRAGSEGPLEPTTKPRRGGCIFL
eukprot:TRINITY_DN10888_c0_g1_i10.p1 TRINITY_DN10888_c0_g1~~TRINITY_DN10888_c0_g1_i10.p1  ORF type:complete len:117 (-),score=28.81 TRINITY_DN10888_c0_g1_i10:221-571(-)